MLNRKELNMIWGYLESLKIRYEKDLADTAQMEDKEIADRLCGDTVRYIEEIKELQKRIDAETAQ